MAVLRETMGNFRLEALSWDRGAQVRSRLTVRRGSGPQLTHDILDAGNSHRSLGGFAGNVAVSPYRVTMSSSARGNVLAHGICATLSAIAYLEDLISDRAIWHNRGWLFGAEIDVGRAAMLLVPLLAAPQLTHDVLDDSCDPACESPNGALALIVASDAEINQHGAG